MLWAALCLTPRKSYHISVSGKIIRDIALYNINTYTFIFAFIPITNADDYPKPTFIIIYRNPKTVYVYSILKSINNFFNKICEIKNF